MRWHPDWIYETMTTALRPVNRGPMTAEQLTDFIADTGYCPAEEASENAEAIVGDLIRERAVVFTKATRLYSLAAEG
jgi:hypothetical protein